MSARDEHPWHWGADGDGALRKQRMGRENYYINHELVDLLFNLPEMKG